MKTYTMYIYRESATKISFDAPYIGHIDQPLSTYGIEVLGFVLEDYIYPTVSTVFVSPQKRSKETADIIFPNNNKVVIDELMPQDFGDWAGVPMQKLGNHRNFFDWLFHGGDTEIPNGEKNNDFFLRIANMFEKIVNACIETATDNVAIVCDVGIIEVLLTLYGIPMASPDKWQCEAGYGYKLRIDPAMWMRHRKIEVADCSPIQK